MASTAPLAEVPTPAGIVVHHLEDSRSQRILWLLEELEVPYTIKFYKRDANRRAPPELLQVHPLGKSPVITDGALTLAESGAIVEYLISKYGKDKFGIKDEGSQAWIDNRFFTHYAEGSVQPVLVSRSVYRIVPSKVPIFIRPIVKGVFKKIDTLVNAPDLERHGKLIESRLVEVESKGGWLAGTGEDRPTSADFLMFLTLQIFLTRAPEYAGPKIKAYVKKVQDRPAYKKGLEKGGQFAYEYKE
ncbi:hypothetical protein NMY22_g9714 [Coprinellus aureogranulatus]|nr:hypothetical protein NMY22_g9714 [Coprinellus aureogranulatus]